MKKYALLLSLTVLSLLIFTPSCVGTSEVVKLGENQFPKVGGMNQFELKMDFDFKRAVKDITKETINDECYVSLEEGLRGINTHLYCN